jgi:hypothetical protein
LIRAVERGFLKKDVKKNSKSNSKVLADGHHV